MQSSDHMKSIGFTNTSNQATELIRLQQQALEEKLKDDSIYRKSRSPFLNNGGSSNLRDINDEYTPELFGDEVIMPSRKAKDNSFNNTLHRRNVTLTSDDGKKRSVAYRMGNA